MRNQQLIRKELEDVNSKLRHLSDSKRIIQDAMDQQTNIKNELEKKLIDTYIKEIKAGDIFSTLHGKVLLIETCGNKFLFGGLQDNLFTLFSDDPRSKNDMISYLNKHKYEFVKNINV